MFVKTALPTLPWRLEAPMTAMDFGANNASRSLGCMQVPGSAWLKRLGFCSNHYPSILPLRWLFEVRVFINSYLRGRLYFTHGAGSPTDYLQAWVGVLWNAGFRRELPWC